MKVIKIGDTDVLNQLNMSNCEQCVYLKVEDINPSIPGFIVLMAGKGCWILN